MVERRETGKIYALKYISKAQVIKMEAVRNILRERQILETLDHAFVVNMRFAFQDDEYMYMCMDLMMGGDLRFHLNRKQFGEDVVRFWIAELCSAISHLHSQGIVHRDIKPDNVLLDEKGHAHLTDFNIGCKLTPEKPFLTSQSGTVAYMAPEVFKGSGYGTSIDWWALGVVFYESIYGRRPFQTENINDLKKAISTQTVEYPEKEGLSRECVSAMRGFLTRDPKERLGVKGGMDGIRQHPFFQAGAYQTNPDNWWYMLETKQLTPKFQPSTEHNNFDATYDLEELLLDDEPLTYRSTRKRAQRMLKEKDKAIKEENARLKAEHEAAAAAAELSMSAMAISAEDYYNTGRDGRDGGYHQQQQQQQPQMQYPRNERPTSDKQLKNKKKSKLYLAGNGAAAASIPTTAASIPTISTLAPFASQFALYEAIAVSINTHIPTRSKRSPRNVWAPIRTATALAAHSIPIASSTLRHSPSPPLNPALQNQSQSQHQYSTSTSSTSKLSLENPKSNVSIAAAMGPGGQQSGSTVSGYSYSTASHQNNHGVTAIYLSKPAVLSTKGGGGGAGGAGYSASYNPSTQFQHHKSKKSFCAEDDLVGKSYPGTSSSQQQHAYQYQQQDQYHQQQQQQQQQQQYPSTSTSSSSSVGGGNNPLPNPLPGRGQLPANSPLHKFAQQQQQQQQLYQPHPQPYNQQQYQTPIQRQSSPATPSGANANVNTPTQAQQAQHAAAAIANAKAAAAAAAEAAADAAMASGNMTRKEKIAYQMALIDREFTTFDYTVYESYNGLVDPLTMSVGDPPEWVRSRDY
ncbi:hypothetical protein BGZ72_002031 [Mortierella alpina]|nr:hypothetical protein BGZ72_002031 [Mortierella alpina]